MATLAMQYSTKIGEGSRLIKILILNLNRLWIGHIDSHDLCFLPAKLEPNQVFFTILQEFSPLSIFRRTVAVGCLLQPLGEH